ncbi:Signal transduction histidine kinase, nitrogen specific [marine gamma proteobacterium HTCC2143]|uniref:Signal transduction histidine kinase, nitrogen specific n=1 Tax=marine gamma proteobacterium HTCC2143 TaxID=247633 RepID=A0YHI5_9GAMM|nr:Signal transduction histidine kinase, nitrogen specific [marine gamma proteobacterium HTCC2143]
MGQQYTEISDKLIKFITEQKIFFVGTATADSKVNISPKGMDALRVLNSNRVIWLNVTGSGNETSAHIQEHPRMTVMFAAFESSPMILRLYGQAKVVHINDPDWDAMYRCFNPIQGARQIFDLTIDMVQTSCGMAVPFFDYVEERGQLKNWASKKGDAGIKDYWRQKNQLSLDGKPTNIVSKNI